jgi:hypothetical protein
MDASDENHAASIDPEVAFQRQRCSSSETKTQKLKSFFSGSDIQRIQMTKNTRHNALDAKDTEDARPLC